MALEKITEAQLNANGVIAAPDVLNGTAAENKAIFDRLVRSIVAPAYNACVDAVSALEALDTGLKTSEAGRVQAELERVAAELKRQTAEQSRDTAEQERKTAEEARQNAETGYVAQANNAATRSQSWAEGGTGSREGEDTNNAKYWAGKAKENAAGGDMKKNVYDPQGKATDIFKYVDEHAPSGGGIYISPDEPTNGETAWYDTDDQQGSFYTAKQIDEMLAELLGFDLLWTNPNPDSEMMAQTVNCTGVDKYGFFVVQYKQYCAEPHMLTAICSYKPNDGLLWGVQLTVQNTAGKTQFRRAVAFSSTGFSIGDCSKLDGTSGQPFCVPYRIYGVRGFKLWEH